MEALVAVVGEFPLQDVMILAIIMEFLAKQHVHVEARILFMRRNPNHPDVLQTRNRIQFFKGEWPILIEDSPIKVEASLQRGDNPPWTMDGAVPYETGFRVQFRHWSTILLPRYAAISKDWYNSTGIFGDQFVRVQTRNPRPLRVSRSSVDEFTVHDNDNEYHVVAGCEILLTFECHTLVRPLHSTRSSCASDP